MFANRACTLWTALALVLPVARAAAQDVFVVDEGGGPGVDFTNLGAAVSAAGEGDTLLIHAGSYATMLTIEARSLSLVADPPGAAVTLYGMLTVEHLSADQLVSVRGVRFTADLAVGQAVHVLDNLGSVWFEDCPMTGPPVSPFLDPPGPGLVADDSAHVVLVRCNVHGNAGAGSFYLHGRAAITMSSSNLRIFDSTLSGGANGCSSGCPSDTSAPGVFVDGGTLLVEGSEISAGDGGLFCPFGPPFCLAGPTGPCIWLAANSPSLLLFDTAFPYGSPEVRIDSGSSTTLPGLSRDSTASSPARVGQPLSLTFQGSAGDQVWLFYGLLPTDVLAPQFSGALLVGNPNQLAPLGTLPGSGTLAFNFTVPSFPAVFESVGLVLQSAFRAGGQTILSDPARVVLLNAGF
jgi:hypothetical protein